MDLKSFHDDKEFHLFQESESIYDNNDSTSKTYIHEITMDHQSVNHHTSGGCLVLSKEIGRNGNQFGSSTSPQHNKNSLRYHVHSSACGKQDNALKTYVKHKLWIQQQHSSTEYSNNNGYTYDTLSETITNGKIYQENVESIVNNQSRGVNMSARKHHIRVGSSYQATIPKLQRQNVLLYHQSTVPNMLKKSSTDNNPTKNIFQHRK